MSFFSSIESIVNSHFDSAALVVNNFGIVEFANKKASELLIIDKALPFFNIFEGENTITAERVFLESKNKGSVVEGNIFLNKDFSGKNSSNYNLRVSPFNIEKEKYFFVSLQKVQYENRFNPENRIKSFSRNELLNKSDADVIKVVEKITYSYPFTLIEKKRIQKEIDGIDVLFWIKDSKGKYITVNKQFAEVLKLNIQDIEGKKSKDILNSDIAELLNMADRFIANSLNGIVLEGISDNFMLDSSSKTEFVVIPISDAEKNIVVTVGFSKKDIVHENNFENEKILSNIINVFPSSAALVNENFDIILSNTQFNEIFNIDKKNARNLKENINLKKIVPSDVFAKINKTLKDKSFSKSGTFNYQLIIGEKLSNVEIKLLEISPAPEGEGKFLFVVNRLGINTSKQTVKEDMYDIIMKKSPEAIFIYEVDNLKFVEVNDAAIKMYGYSKKEFEQMDLTDLYTPEDIQSLLESTNDKNNLSGSFTGPWRHKRKDGSSILVEISKTEIDNKGKKVHINVIRDITNSVNSKKELQLFKTIFENSRDLIILTDTEGFITFTNEPVNEILGFFDAELDKRPFLSLLSDGDRAKVNTNIFHSGKNEINTFDIKLKNSEGEFISAKIIATPIQNYRNEVESFSLILQPKVEEKDLVKSSVQPNKETTKNNLDPSFLSNLFHELLTPINVIIGFVQELVDSIPEPTEEQIESADIIKENQKVLLHTMDTAVEYSNLEQKEFEIKSEEVLFVDILDGIEEETKKESSIQNVELSYSKISSSLSFFTDKHKFNTFITLFVEFAMKMTEEDKLFMSAFNFGDASFVVSLKDNRKGITPKLLKNLRELFIADESIIRHNFGISRFSVRLIRKLINLLAEKREVILKKDNPFEFGIVFPIKLASVFPNKIEDTTSRIENAESDENTIVTEMEPVQNDKPEEREIEKPKRAAVEVKSNNSGTKNIDFSQLSCLYVEDQIDSQILFKIQMKELKEMEFVTNFEDAIPLFKTKSFNFIVLDINLQGEYNGLDALHIIRKMPVYHDVPVIAVSAYVLPGDRENFIAAGFNDFITKPVLQDKLYDSLRKIF